MLLLFVESAESIVTAQKEITANHTDDKQTDPGVEYVGDL